MATAIDLCKIISSWDLSANLKSYSHSLFSYSNEAITHIIEVLPSEHKFRIFLSRTCIDSFSSDDDWAFLISSKIWFKDLFFGTHDCCHGGFDRADQIIGFITIIVDHFEFEFLFFLKEILDCESLFEIGV